MTVLVVDLGTANTVAVVAGGEPRLVTVDGAPWIPSAVFAGADGLVVGVDAVRLGRDAAAGYVRSPKAGKEQAVPVTDAVRAVLARIVAAAGAAPDELVLTHPADWAQPRVGVLLAAAAGLAPKISTVTEPLAAAAGADLATGQALLVIDLGGGTCDIAVVRRDSTGLVMLAAGGLPDLGGDDLDRRIIDRVAPSLREPVESARDRQLLADSAREAKELLSRHDSADIVLPDHRAVRLTRAEFEELIAPDVDRVVALASRVVGQAGTGVERVLLVGGSSRVPLLARRLAEASGRPVSVDPEPETAVARGAALLVTSPPATGARPGLRVALAALALMVSLVVAAVLVLPGRETTGQPMAGAGPTTTEAATELLTMPPVVPGVELVNGDRPLFDDGELAEPITYRHASGTELELVFDRMETRPFEPGRYGEAPPGYRWLYIQYRATHVAGPEWPQPFRSTAALDDRGQWIRAPGGGGVPCEGTDAPVTSVPVGAAVEVCGVLPVPEQTTVEALVFGDQHPAPGERSPLRVPVSALSVSGAGPAPASIAGRLGGPPVAVRVGDLQLTAAFELVATPSGYLGERRPGAGNRLVVVRAALSVVVDEEIYLRDDRGVLTMPLTGVGDLPDCPPLTASDVPVYGCLVYEVDADSPIAGVTVGWSLDGPAARGSDIAGWPTWTP
jgi:actin-like ATPase involved in cell morphogenesis